MKKFIDFLMNLTLATTALPQAGTDWGRRAHRRAHRPNNDDQHRANP